MTATMRRIADSWSQGRGGSVLSMLRRMGVDAAAMLALLALVAVAFLPAYGTSLIFVTVMGAGVLGMAVGLVATQRRWRSAQVLGATVLAWFLLGTPLVMPSAGLLGVIPTGRSLRGLLGAPVTAWRDMLALDPPIGETTNLLAVPALVALMAGLLAALITLRSRRPALAWLPLLFAWVVGITLGSSVAVFPVAAGAAFFVVVLLWTTHRRAAVSATLVGRTSRPLLVRGALGAVSLLVAGGVAVAAVPLLAPDAPRTTARQAVVPPIEIEESTSPLQGFRANVSDDADTPLMEVSGVAEGQIIRVATLDRYDGVSFTVATTDDTDVEGSTFTRVGAGIADDTAGEAGEAGVTIGGYSSVWVPTVGRTTSISFAGDRSVALTENFYYNRASGTGITLTPLSDGDSYSLGTITPARPPDDEITRAGAGGSTMPMGTRVPDELRNLAHAWGDSRGTAGAQALELEAGLSAGWFSHGQTDEVQSLSGHTDARLTSLVANLDRMVGDGEQYAAAMVLMARELGIPARVIYGYRANGSSTITGSDVGAWAELELDGLGWVVFHPTPPEDRVLDENEPPRQPTPQPHIENPPPPAQEPDNPPLEDDLPIDASEPPVQRDDIDWGRIGVFAVLAGIPLLTIVVPLTLVVGLKLRRRARRRNDPEIGNRVAGAWSEVVDRARDLGRAPSPAATRTEQAEQLMGDFPRIRQQSDPMAMSRQADHLVFAPEDPTPEVASAYWRDARGIEGGLRRSVRWPRWLLSRLSTKSFRRLR